MSKHTSWRIGGAADYFCVVEDVAQLEGAVQVATAFSLPWLVLGGGNNVLISDRGVEGLVILNRLRGLAIDVAATARSTAGHAVGARRAELACGAGVFFARAAQYSARQGYTGMEWGIAIPGTVGGGVVNNAGAHWSDVSRALVSVEVVGQEGERARLTPADLAYRYRQSTLKSSCVTQSRLVVTGCRFGLEADTPEVALARVAELRRHRLRTQPVKEASAGSTFKNPPGEHAGALIDRAGLKGHQVGGAQIALLHANFILNTGRAQACDVVSLIRLVQSAVQARFGIRLEPEIQFVGRWESDELQAILGEAA
jgi:UDP-N-acetylmuramate dehydrogenase